jgi:multiple sugar transport system ATP-binding protein
MAQVLLEQVSKVYPGGVKAVDGLDLAVADREFVVLVGPSGCGKSTTLRMIAGLEDVTSGTVRIGERVVNRVPPKDRDVAMVFQNYALYPHMTVYRNMEFALKLRKVPKPQRKARVLEAARILDIEHLLNRKPRQLSGGQRQRVAVGRAIVREPAAFLFDEPLSNLDARLRVTTRAELKRLHQRLRTTTVYVTHDQEEAMTLGDRIVVMRDGKIQQADTPLTTYNYPVNRFVAGFIGMPPMNFFDGMLRPEGGGLVFEEGRLEASPTPGAAPKGDEVGAERLTLPGNGFRLVVPPALAQPLSRHAGRHVVLGVRPEHFGLHGPQDVPHDRDRLDVRISVVEPLGSQMDVYLSTAHHGNVVGRVPARQGLEPGQRAAVVIDLARAHFFEPGEAGSNLSLETAMARGASSSSPATEPAHAIA